MVPELQCVHGVRPLKANRGNYVFKLAHVAIALIIVQVGARSEPTAQLNFTLLSYDGSYYPYLDALLQNPKASYIVGSAKELRDLPEFSATTSSFTIDGRKVVVGESFFSVFSAAQIPLWEVVNGTTYVPTYFDVRNGSELLLVGFHLNWAALPTPGHVFNTPSSAFAKYPALVVLLLRKLQLYVEVSGTGRVQLLHTVVGNLSCDGLRTLVDGLRIVSNTTEYLINVGQNIKPSFRLVYPYLFIKYAQLGPIWVEDVTISCAEQAANPSAATCPPPPPVTVNVSSHADLVAALQRLDATPFASSCETRTTVLSFQSSITLDVAQWPRDGGGLFISSNVTFACAPGAGLFLDFNGGLNLFKLRAAAFVQIHNLAVINLAMAPVGIFTVPIWAFNFERDLTAVGEGRLHMVNTTGVVARDEFALLNFWTGIMYNPVQMVAALAAWQRLITDMHLDSLSNDTIRLASITGMGVTCVNIVLTIVPIPGVNLLVPQTGVNQLLGSEVLVAPPYTVAIYSAAQLRRMLATPEDRLTRLATADGLTNGNTSTVVLLLQNNITLDPGLWPGGGSPLPVRRPIVIQGKPFSGVVLDFGRGTGFITPVAPAGEVAFRYLTLRSAGWVANYTPATALQQLPPPSFLQSGMWVVGFERTGVPKVSLKSARLLVSPQEMDILLTCLGSYNQSGVSVEGATGAVALPPGLQGGTCSQLLPSSAQVVNASRTSGILVTRTLDVSAFESDGLVLATDWDVSRTDLVLFMEDAYPDSAGAFGGTASRSETNVGAIIGGAVGGAVACVVLLALALLLVARRNRAKQQEEALRGLQAKQANQLEELSKRNPLAQLILDHLAGKEPAAPAKLVIAAGSSAATTSPNHFAVNSTEVGRTSSATASAGGAGGCGSTNEFAVVDDTSEVRCVGAGSGGGAAAAAAARAASAPVPTATTREPSAAMPMAASLERAAAAAPAETADAGTTAADGTAAPINIAAVELAELFRHLTILGVANMSHPGDPIDSRGSRGSRGSRSGIGRATVNGAVSSGSSPAPPAGGAASQPYSGLLALPHAVLHRLGRWSRTRGSMQRERDSAGSRRASSGHVPAGGGGGSGGGKGGEQRRASSDATSALVAAAASAAAAVAASGAVASGGTAGDAGAPGTHAAAAGAAAGAGASRTGTRGSDGGHGGPRSAAAVPSGEQEKGAGAAAPGGASAGIGGAGAAVSRGNGGGGGGGGGGAAAAGSSGGSGGSGTTGAAGSGGSGAGGSGDTGATKAAAAAAAVASLPVQLHEQVAQSPVLEELLRLSLDLASEIDDNQLIVTEVVASGGFGTVYKGMWHNLPVAVKIVLFSTASVNRRIALQEAALSKSISHPNIIATYAVDAKPMAVLGKARAGAVSGGAAAAAAASRSDAGSRSLAEIQEWRLYIIQEFADGGTLRRALDTGAFHEPHLGLPRLDMILDIVQGVAAALAHLHSKNVVHGDLNPKNVLLKILPAGSSASLASGRSAGASGGFPGAGGKMAGAAAAAAGSTPMGCRGGASSSMGSGPGSSVGVGSSQYGTYPLAGRCGYAIKVADFGLSVKMENSHISGLRQGTPFYAAPELSQLGIFSRAADAYAFGVLMWELYWGRPIWVPDARAPGGYVQHVDFPLLPPDCPPEYASLMAECLQLNHMQRPCFEDIVVRLRFIVHSVRYLFTPTVTPPSGSLSSFDGSLQISMPGLPALLQQNPYNLSHQYGHGMPAVGGGGGGGGVGEKAMAGQGQVAGAAWRHQTGAGQGGGAAVAGAAAGQHQHRHGRAARVKPVAAAPMAGTGAAAAAAYAAQLAAAMPPLPPLPTPPPLPPVLPPLGQQQQQQQQARQQQQALQQQQARQQQQALQQQSLQPYGAMQHNRSPGHVVAAAAGAQGAVAAAAAAAVGVAGATERSAPAPSGARGGTPSAVAAAAAAAKATTEAAGVAAAAAAAGRQFGGGNGVGAGDAGGGGGGGTAAGVDGASGVRAGYGSSESGGGGRSVTPGAAGASLDPDMGLDEAPAQMRPQVDVVRRGAITVEVLDLAPRQCAESGAAAKHQGFAAGTTTPDGRTDGSAHAVDGRERRSPPPPTEAAPAAAVAASSGVSAKEAAQQPCDAAATPAPAGQAVVEPDPERAVTRSRSLGASSTVVVPCSQEDEDYHGSGAAGAVDAAADAADAASLEQWGVMPVQVLGGSPCRGAGVPLAAAAGVPGTGAAAARAAAVSGGAGGHHGNGGSCGMGGGGLAHPQAVADARSSGLEAIREEPEDAEEGRRT